MGLVDFFSKKSGGRKNNSNFRDQFSSSEEESDDSSFRRDRRRTKTTRRRTKNRRKSSRPENQFDNDSNDVTYSDEILTREELFDLPARELRKKCKSFHINTSDVFEKLDLVSLLYDYYRKQSSENTLGRHTAEANMSSSRHGGNRGRMMARPSNNTTTSTRIELVNNDHDMMNSRIAPESEQMVEILQEIIPYFNQGDLNIDEIVKDTIERLPLDNLENRDKDGNSLLLICSHFSGACELIPLLISKGSDPNAQNTFGETCLHFTSYTDTYSPETAKVLVLNGANAEVQEIRFGCTALHYAASIGDTDLCRILLEGGASPLTPDKNHCNPIGYATQSKKQDCIDLLTKSSQSWVESESKSAKFDGAGYESDWAQLIDDQTGFPYFYNRNTGNSMWADEYREFKHSKAHQKSTPIAFVQLKREQSFRRAPSSFAEVKSSRSLKECDEQKDIMPEIASGKVDVAEEKINDMFESKETYFKSSHAVETGARSTSVTNEDVLDILGNDIENILSDCSTSSQSSSENSDGNDVKKPSKETKLQIEVPSKEITLSPTSTPTLFNSKKLVSKESFNLRLNSIQEKWTLQLQKNQNEIEDIQRIKKSENKLSLELRELCTELEKKDIEIDRLKSDIQELNADSQSIASPKVSVKEVAIGEQDVRDEVWVASKQFGDIEEKLALKEEEISEFHEQCLKLQTSLGTKDRFLVSMEEKQKRNNEQMMLLEDLLQKEKDAKNEAVVLVEQTRAGIAGSAEVTQLLKDEKKRGDESDTRLRRDINALESKLANEQNETARQLEDSEKKVIHHSTQLSALRKELETCTLSHKDYKVDLVKRHQDELGGLLSTHQTDKTNLERELQNQRDARAEIEAEKVRAFEKCEEAERKAKDAQMHVDEMSAMLNQAKALVAANENLHKSLHAEIGKRKQLHNKLEDLKGRIRVYVRVRPLSKSEISMNCKESLIKEDKRTCVMHPDTERGETKSWEFDHCFSGDSNGNTQEDVFKDSKELITSAIDGFNVCIFCYGQTGSGKVSAV